MCMNIAIEYILLCADVCIFVCCFRSSIGFYQHHPSTEKEIMDKFLLTLTGGIHVRRHQANRVAETVRLFSINGCRTIQWEPPRAKDLQQQRMKQGVHHRGRTSAIYNSEYDKSGFDCCISCECPSSFSHTPFHMLHN